MRNKNLLRLAASLSLVACTWSWRATTEDATGAEAKRLNSPAAKPAVGPDEPLPKTNAEWKKRLTGEQYYILRLRRTERAFTGKYWNTKKPGVYRCAGCSQPLFDSAAKFRSGTGWPSYWRPYGNESVKAKPDRSHGMLRVEVVCSRCDGHLGHVFRDGPPPTGLRFCINSAALLLDESTPPPSAKDRDRTNPR
jgi:peptide-methionine (R)-S-oxide reductase